MIDQFLKQNNQPVMRSLFTLLFFLFFLFDLISQPTFQKRIGNASDNRLGKVIFHANNYYVLGKNDTKATVSKLDINGNLVWTNQTNTEAFWNDIIVNKDGNLMVVGSLGSNQGNTNNNASLCGVINTGSGVFTVLKSFQIGFRELLNRIYINPVPNNNSFPYYVVGTKTSSSGSNDDDLAILTFDTNFNFGIGKTYTNGSDDDQLHYDVFFGGTNGAMMAIGNNYNGNFFEGRTATIGKDLVPLSGRDFGQSVIFFSGLSLPNSTGGFQQILAGTTTSGPSDAVIIKANGLTTIYSYKIPALDVINYMSTGATGNIFAIGRGEFGGITKTVILNLQDNNTSLTLNWAKVLDQGETVYSHGYLNFILPDKLMITDSRLGGNAVIGDFDGLFCVEQNNLENCMDVTVNVVLVANPMNITEWSISSANIGNITFTNETGALVSYQATNPCAPPCNITSQIQNQNTGCGLYQFQIQSAGGTGPYSYQWDFNCDGTNEQTGSLISHSFSNPGTQQYCITVTDAIGCTATDSKTIVVVGDFLPPVITCPPHITVECADDILADLAETGNATATDDVDPNPDLVYEDNIQGTTCSYISTRIWTATDNCQRTNSCTQLITVIDRLAPEIVCPPNLTLSCDADLFDNMITGTATASDQCANSFIISSNVGNGQGGACNSMWPKTYTATDICGNSRSCTQTITLRDNVPPVILCPTDKTISCEQIPLPSLTGTAIAEDNCQTNTLTPTYSDMNTGAGCEVAIIRTWTINDGCGNISSCQQTIQFDDFLPPNMVCPPDVTISCETPADQINTGSATASDNCQTNLVIGYSDFVAGNNCNKIITRFWNTNDGCGNPGFCYQVITQIDITAPTINCPPNTTISCNAITTPANTGMATASDNCSVNILIRNTDVFTALGCTQNLIRTWTATDECGLFSNCIQTITLTDDLSPTITCPAGVTVSCDSNTDPLQTGSATASDFCQINIVISYNDVIAGDDCDKTITRTWTADDGCNNTMVCIQTITVRDLIPPTFICPGSNLVSIECSSNPNLGVPVNISDNCGGRTTFLSSDVIHNDGCFTIVTRTWVVSDECGNSSSCEQVITMQDTKPPVISGCGRKITVQGIRNVDGLCMGDVTLTSPGIFDQCDEEVVLTNSYTLTEDASGSYPLGQTIIIWTAKDDCGLMAMCKDTIIVLDCPDCCWDQNAFNAVAAMDFNIIRDECSIYINHPGLTPCQRVKYTWSSGESSGYLTGTAHANHNYLVSGDYTICALIEEVDTDGMVCFFSNKCYDLCVTCGDGCTDDRLVSECYDFNQVTRYQGSRNLTKYDLVHSGQFIYAVNSILKSTGNTEITVTKMDAISCGIIEILELGGEGFDEASSVIVNSNGSKLIVAGIFESTTITIPSSKTTLGSDITLTGINSPGIWNGFLMQIDLISGTMKVDWAFSLGYFWRDNINDIAVDANGNIYIVGSIRGQGNSTVVNFAPLGISNQAASNLNAMYATDVYTAFVANYDPDGKLIWYDVIQPYGVFNSIDGNASIGCGAIDIDGSSIYVGGYFQAGYNYVKNHSAILLPHGLITLSVNPSPLQINEHKAWSNFIIQYSHSGSRINSKELYSGLGNIFAETNQLRTLKLSSTDIFVGGSNFITKLDKNTLSQSLSYNSVYEINDLNVSGNKLYTIGSSLKGNPNIDFMNITQPYSIGIDIPVGVYDFDLNLKKSIIIGGNRNDFGYGLEVNGQDIFIQGISQSQDFKFDPSNGGLLSASSSSDEATIFIGKYSCTCESDTDCCEDVSASFSGQDECCQTLGLVNNAGFDICEVSVELTTPDWILNSSSSASGYVINPIANGIEITHTSGTIPTGTLNNIAEFCLSGNPDAPTTQQFIVNWYETTLSGNKLISCTDTLTMTCDPPPPPLACLDFNLISVICDPDDDQSYLMTFTITNLTSDVNATSLYLSDLPPGFYFESCGGGGPVTSINIPIGPPIGSGQTSGILCVMINTNGAILSPEDICFDLQLKGLDGNIFICCNAPEPECITIQPCCDPCEDISFTVEPLEENPNGCCYALNMDNSCQYDYFTKMEIQVNTANVHFGYINAAVGWSNCATPSLQSLCIQPNSGIFPNGDHVPTLGFCLTNINDVSQVPQDIVISLYSTNDLGVEFIACEKALQLACDTIPNDSCLIVTNSTAFCDQENEKYFVSVTIENNSNPDFCANEVVITPLDAGDVIPSVIVLPDFLCHGESTTITFMITNLPFPDADGMFELIFSLKNNLSEECCQGGVAHIDTILLPDCPCATTCCEDLPEHDFESYGLGNLPNTQVGWQNISGIPSVISGGSGGSSHSAVLPAHTRVLMPSAIEYRHAGVGGPDLILPENSLICLNFWAKLNPIVTLPVNGLLTIQFDHTTVHSLIISHTNSAWTYYELSLITPPGGVYTLQFVNNSGAPVDYGPSIQLDDICFEVKNQIYDDMTPPEISCPDDITLLDTDADCMVEYTIPNLSITDPSGISLVEYYLNGNLVTVGSSHSLDNSMIHEVECIVEDGCGNQATCTYSIEVECAEDCCFDPIKFINLVEAAVTYTIDNASCTTTVNISDLPDCDYIQNINWGDGTNVPGPFTGGEILTHTYSGNGTFNITMLAIETNPVTGLICFEHFITRVITMNCSACICPTIPPTFTITQGQVRTDIPCGNSVTLDCPVTDLFINGIFRCESTIPGQSCPPNSVSWVLDRPTLPNMSGTSGSTVSFMLDAVNVQEPGVYTLTFTTLCADSPAPCVCSISWIQLDCNSMFCPDNIITNGDFESGDPSGTNDDINMATGWGGIWGSNGSETGEYLSTGGGPFSFPHPIPASQNGYAGFWLDKSSDDNKREGIMNQLNTPILPNTGCYSLEFKIACLGGQYNSPTLEIYGVNVGASATTAPISQIAPTNTNLFTPPPVLLGSYLVNTDVCNNSFLTVTIDFDSGIVPPGGFDRIFFTRQDVPMGQSSRGAFIAMDDVCLSSVPCAPVCTCPANQIFRLEKDNDIFQITCGQMPPQIPQLGCPISDIFISGIFNCESSIPGQNCPPNSVDWVLIRPTLPNLTGTSGSTISLMMNAVDVQEPGLYSLTFTTLCADSPEPCVCDISWMQECIIDTCCKDPHKFMQATQSATTLTFDHVLCKGILQVADLGECIKISQINWGDGTFTNGPLNTGNMFMHVYSTNGVYPVSISFYEENIDGQKCFDNTVLVQRVTTNCNQTCVCTPGFKTKFNNVQVTCNATVSVPCNRTSVLSGSLGCSPSTCKPTSLRYKLYTASGLLITQSTIASPTFNITLLPGWFDPAGGLYYIELEGYCGTNLCTCRINLKVDPCPRGCLCGNDFVTQVGLGYFTNNLGNCRYGLTPKNLCPGDKVTWIYNSTVMATTASNVSFIFNMPNVVPNQICMEVTRQDVNGNKCTAQYCQHFRICNPPLLEPVCMYPTNGGFDIGMSGSLPDIGGISNWSLISGEAYAVDHDDSSHYVMMVSNANLITDIHQDCCIDPNVERIINFFGVRVKNEGLNPLPAGTKLQIFAPQDVTISGLTELKAEVDISHVGYDWEEISVTTFSDPNWKFNNLIVRLTNPEDEFVSVAVDDLCLDFYITTDNPENDIDFSLFPNPTTGDIKISFSKPIDENVFLDIKNILGQTLSEISISKGTQTYEMSLAQLPEGVYLLHFRDSGKRLGSKKIIKIQ